MVAVTLTDLQKIHKDKTLFKITILLKSPWKHVCQNWYFLQRFSAVTRNPGKKMLSSCYLKFMARKLKVLAKGARYVSCSCGCQAVKISLDWFILLCFSWVPSLWWHDPSQENQFTPWFMSYKDRKEKRLEKVRERGENGLQVIFLDLFFILINKTLEKWSWKGIKLKVIIIIIIIITNTKNI